MSDGETHAHQLPGVAGSSPGNKIICQGERLAHPSEDGQHNCPHIHKQIRGHSLPRTEQADQRAMALVPGQEYNTRGHTPSRHPKLHSRRRVTCDARQIRLDAVSQSIQQNEPQNRTTSGGPVCLPTNPPAQGLCEPETRSRGNGNRCLYTGLDEVQGVCKPTMEPGGKGPDACQEPTSTGDTDCTDLEGTSLVPSPAGDASSGTTPASSKPKSDITDSQSQQTRHNPPSSRMGYLRDRFRGQNLSEEASKLLLASWRQKTSKSYDSLFGKWVRWCHQRDTNPIYGDINVKWLTS